MASKHSPVAFVGVGSMGRPMALQLAHAGYFVMAYDANDATLKSLEPEPNIECAGAPADAASSCDIVITMLPTSAIVEEALTGFGGVLETLRPGTTVIDMSSGVPMTTIALAEKVRAAGGELVDAPVSGGVQRALTGDLSIMFGGAEETLLRVEPLLKTMGSSVVRTGGVGTAHAMKALNNLVSAGGFLIGIEALMIGRRFGLTSETMVDVLNASTGMNNSTQKKFKQFVLSGRYNSGFSLELMVKDLGIALGMSDGNHKFSALCRQIWSNASISLGKEADHTEVAKYLLSESGLDL